MDSIADRLRAAGCVFAEDEAELLTAEAPDPATLDALVARRAGGEPLEQVLGWAEFMGLRLVVEPGVFVPRRRTELLARTAISRAFPGAVVVDLCCGAGSLGAAVAGAVEVELHAADIDPAAVKAARRNLPGARVYEGDLFAALPGGLLADVVTANVPYVPSHEIALMPAEARDHEPRAALDGGGDGLEVARRAIAGAPRWLAPAGSLLVETSAAQAPAAAEAMHAAGLRPAVVTDPELEATVVAGRAF